MTGMTIDCKLYTFMPKPQVNQQQTPPQPVQPQAQPKIYVKNQPSGGLSVTFQMDANETARLMRKAGGMALDRFIWDNIIHRAVESFLY